MSAPEQSTLQIAIDYVRRGWAPLRIPLRAKAPTFKNWPSFRITEAEAPQHFDRACNIGVILGQASGGLTDVDLDCPEAIDLAPEILSPTPAVFGRKSKPESHWLYRVEGESPTEKLTDPLTGETLVELRGNGGLQTVFPGSVHPSGELIEWFNDEAFNNETPKIIEADRLRKEVRELAAYSLITRYYKGAEDVTDDKCLEEALKTLDHRVVERIQIWLSLQPSANGSLSAHHNDSTPIFGPSSFGSPPAHLAGRQTKSFNLDHLNPKFRAEPILSGCAQMQRLRDDAANQSRDSWWHCLGTLAFCEGGDPIAHQLSSGHPKYSYEETQRELDGWRAKADGASLCETFDRKIPGICGKCPTRAAFGAMKSAASRVGTFWPPASPKRRRRLCFACGATDGQSTRLRDLGPHRGLRCLDIYCRPKFRRTRLVRCHRPNSDRDRALECFRAQVEISSPAWGNPPLAGR